MLLETLAGHIALLESVNPRKANSAITQRTLRYIKASLKRPEGARRQAA
jgi:hypothetical protein